MHARKEVRFQCTLGEEVSFQCTLGRRLAFNARWEGGLLSMHAGGGG